jgi:hypothetical protein
MIVKDNIFLINACIFLLGYKRSNLNFYQDSSSNNFKHMQISIFLIFRRKTQEKKVNEAVENPGYYPSQGR